MAVRDVAQSIQIRRQVVGLVLRVRLLRRKALLRGRSLCLTLVSRVQAPRCLVTHAAFVDRRRRNLGLDMDRVQLFLGVNARQFIEVVGRLTLIYWVRYLELHKPVPGPLRDVALVAG